MAYKIGELGHAWYYGERSASKASAMFFEGDSIYSWGKHYEIARKLSNGYVLFNAVKHGTQSTSEHCNIVHFSIPDKEDIIYVKKFFSLNYNKGELNEIHKENLQYYLNEIEALLKAIFKSNRKSPVKKQNAVQYRNRIKKYISVFNVPAKIIPAEAKKLLKRTDFEVSEADRKFLEQKQKREAAAVKKEQEDKELKMKKDIASWKRGSNGRYNLASLSKVLLRVNGNIIETSHGAKLTVNEGKVLWKYIQNGSPTARPGQLIKLPKSGFEVKSWDGNALHIGCHLILKSELNYICKKLGWKTIP
jgi:hypothetical protein